MRKVPLVFGIAIFFGLNLANAQMRMVTVLIDSANQTNSISVGPNEAVDFKTVVDRSPWGSAALEISTRGKVLVNSIALSGAYNRGFPIAGPAPVSLTWQPASGQSITSTSFAWMTLEVSPASFPPDKTVIIPQGTGARLALECSTNLVSWTEIWAETYTNVPSNKFFRIKAERTP